MPPQSGASTPVSPTTDPASSETHQSSSSTSATPTPPESTTVDLTWQPATLKTRHSSNHTSVWLLSEDQRCVDFLRTQLREAPKFKWANAGMKTAPAWNEMYEGVDKQSGLARVICKHCKWHTRHPNAKQDKSPGQITKHIGEQCPSRKKIKLRHVEKAGDPFEEFFNLKKPMTTERLCETVLNIIVEGNLSFRQAENPALQNLLREAFPTCSIPNRRSVAKRLTMEASMARGLIRDRFAEIDSKVSLALDAWTSKNNNFEFLGIFP
jgi:hypothetical protein